MQNNLLHQSIAETNANLSLGSWPQNLVCKLDYLAQPAFLGGTAWSNPP